MFERTVIRHSQGGATLTPGEIAEALLFYQNVHIIMDPLSLKPLMDSLGPYGLLRLLERKRVSGFYAEDMCITQNYPFSATQQLHSFATATIAGGRNESSPRKGKKGRLTGLLEAYGLSRLEAERFVDRFARAVKIDRYSSDFLFPGGVHKAANEDVTDQAYISEAARTIIANTTGFEQFASSLQFEIVPVGERFAVRTNIDFEVGNNRRKSAIAVTEDFTESNILSGIFDARVDVTLAAHYGADFYTSAVNSSIMRLRRAELLKRTGLSIAELVKFNEVVLPNYPNIREVIDSGQRSFDDFLKLLDHADKFKHWLHGASPDSDLVREYVEKLTAEGWISSVPARLVRYMIAAAVGHFSEYGGMAVAAADMFLVERMFKGWRPNHFVDGKLRPFLGSEESD